MIRPNEKGKIILPGAAGGRSKRFKEPYKFKEKLEKLNATGKLDREDFNSGKEIGEFIDWCNELNTKGKQKSHSNDILEITKLLVKLANTKSVVVNGSTNK